MTVFGVPILLVIFYSHVVEYFFPGVDPENYAIYGTLAAVIMMFVAYILMSILAALLETAENTRYLREYLEWTMNKEWVEYKKQNGTTKPESQTIAYFVRDRMNLTESKGSQQRPTNNANGCSCKHVGCRMLLVGCFC